jgi:hypothetical protein
MKILVLALMSVLLFFGQHAMAQQLACSPSEMASYNLEKQRAQECVLQNVPQYGVNGYFACMRQLVAGLNGAVSQSCLSALKTPPAPVAAAATAVRTVLLADSNSKCAPSGQEEAGPVPPAKVVRYKPGATTQSGTHSAIGSATGAALIARRGRSPPRIKTAGLLPRPSETSRGNLQQ